MRGRWSRNDPRRSRTELSRRRSRYGSDFIREIAMRGGVYISVGGLILLLIVLWLLFGRG